MILLPRPGIAYVEPTPGFESGTFSLPTKSCIGTGVCEISTITSHPKCEDGRLYLLSSVDDLWTEGSRSGGDLRGL